MASAIIIPRPSPTPAGTAGAVEAGELIFVKATDGQATLKTSWAGLLAVAAETEDELSAQRSRLRRPETRARLRFHSGIGFF